MTAFRGDDRFLADYLRSELLSRLPPDELRFLTRTSVLERMSGPLCDAVLDSSGSAAALESLERSNLFMVPLDRTGEWYRYHHLFQELLRAELGRVEPDLLPRLLARAADWCEANGQPEAAIGYAQAADDVNRTARLFVRNYLDTYNSGRAATVERWLGWLDAHGAIETNAAVAVIGGLTAALWGRPAEAERCADAAERASYDGTLYDGSASIDSWHALMRAQHCRRGVASDAHRCGARGGDPCPWEPVETERHGAARDFALAGRRHRPRPTTSSPTSPRRGSRWGRGPR